MESTFISFLTTLFWTLLRLVIPKDNRSILISATSHECSSFLVNAINAFILYVMDVRRTIIWYMFVCLFCSIFILLSRVNLLLVRSHQAEIIIVKRLIQGRNNVSIWVEVEPRSRNRDHTVAIRTAL